MRRRFKYGKLIKWILILLVIGALGSFAYKSYKNMGERWVGVESGFISISSNHRGLIITDEIVYRTLNAGQLENTENEGARIKKSQVIGTFVTGGAAGESQLPAPATNEEENAALLNEEDGKDVSIDKNQVKLDADNLYAELKSKLKNRENKEAKEIKRKLVYTLEHLNKLGKKTYTANANFNENEKFIGFKDALTEQSFNIISTESGVVSYFIDDLTGKLKYEDRYNLNYEKLLNDKHDFVNNINRKVNRNDKLLKIIYKQKWYLLCESSLEDLDTYKIDDKLHIHYNRENFDAVIVDKFKSKDLGILCLEVSQVLESLNSSRVINVTIESDEVSGVKIPPEAIVSEHYIKGVYVKGPDEEKIFRPIQILGYEGDLAIVSEGSYTYRDESGGLKTVDTVNRNDKILIKND